MTEQLIAVVASVIAAGGTIPYIVETVKGKTKPRIVTWSTWSLLTGMAAAAAFSDGQLASGLFALLGSLATAAIAIAGFRYGDRSLTPLDISCLSGVIVGLVLWRLFDSPALAVWAAIAIDLTGFIPTLVHAWRAPHEETLITYALVSFGGFLSVAAALLAGGISVTALGYPLYAAVSMGSCGILSLVRLKQYRGLVSASSS